MGGRADAGGQPPGVADVVGMGGYLKGGWHVEVDPARMAAYNLTLGDITAALERSNQNVEQRSSHTATSSW